MIKIIRGVYGARKNGRVVPITKESAPVQLSQKEEARLVNAGFAEYVETTEPTATEPTQNGEPTAETTPTATEPTAQNGDLETLSFNELKAMAAEMGLTVKGNSKKDYIAAIKDAEEVEAPNPDAAPTFDAGSTVV